MVNDASKTVVRDALMLALRFAEGEYEMRGSCDANYDIKAGDVIADVRDALDLLDVRSATGIANGDNNAKPAQ